MNYKDPNDILLPNYIPSQNFLHFSSNNTGRMLPTVSQIGFFNLTSTFRSDSDFHVSYFHMEIRESPCGLYQILHFYSIKLNSWPCYSFYCLLNLLFFNTIFKFHQHEETVANIFQHFLNQDFSTWHLISEVTVIYHFNISPQNREAFHVIIVYRIFLFCSIKLNSCFGLYLIVRYKVKERTT